MTDSVATFYSFVSICAALVSFHVASQLWIHSGILRRKRCWRASLDAFLTLVIAVCAFFFAVCLGLAFLGFMVVGFTS